MCGIFCVFSHSEVNVTEELSKIFQQFSLNINKRGPNQSRTEICHNDDRILLFAASVLWLQGSKYRKQPINDDEFILVYNGDIFNNESKEIRAVSGDTKLFLDFFKSEQLFKSLFDINGPFSFICLDKKKSTLYFGRDKYGRRSLLIGKSVDGKILLSSVAKRGTNFEFMEIPSVGIFVFNLKENTLSLKPWYRADSYLISKVKDLEQFLERNIKVADEVSQVSLVKDFNEPTRQELHFSDNLKHFACASIFDAITSSDKLRNNNIKLKQLLEHSVLKRIISLPEFCQNCIRDRKPCNHCITGILFSGGVDCAILAILADKFVDRERPIDLLNVAFSKDNFDTPDRITGRQTLEELRQLCPQRKWNFIEVDITNDELNKERSNRIADLIYPLKTILDDSLGCALWFASRGVNKTYVSTCRVILAGMGADELFGGYSRHRAAFMNEKWRGLHDVLKKDWESLPYRNLGRDDRVVSDHGRQLRTPYLDEDVVKFVQSLNCWERSLPIEYLSEDIGPKFFLRALAHHLGLKKASGLKKRALQFGTRIANSKENAHEISPRL